MGATNRIAEIYKHGQSIWYDNIRRGLLVSGEIKRLIDAGEIAGITSNPAIFNQAIAASTDYDDALTELVRADPQAEIKALYEALVIEDIRTAAGLLRSVYERTDGMDGYVSLEVSPDLAHRTEETVAEAGRLFATIDRPNVLMKVPATVAGLPAITQLIAAGVKVNATLIFSVQDYLDVSGAYLSGLEQRSAAGDDLRAVTSVASFFVSRTDSVVDEQLPEGSPLRGRIAVANTKVAYDHFRKTFAGPRFAPLKAQGGRVQRFLNASTGAKTPDYRDVKYVEELIGPDTINTVPPRTLDAFRDHGQVRESMTEDLAGARDDLAAVKELGIDLEAIAAELKEEGAGIFTQSFHSLLDTLAKKREAILAR